MRACAAILIVGLAFGAHSDAGAQASVPDGQQPPMAGVPTDINGKVEMYAPSEEMLKLRDPFKRPEVASMDVVPRTPLEKFPSDSYKMLAVLTGPARMQVLLQDPDGQTHFVSEKMVIGTRKGKIKKITSDSVLILEKVVNVLGQEESLEVVLRLPTEGPSIRSAPKADESRQPEEEQEGRIAGPMRRGMGTLPAGGGVRTNY